jgi:hypothetical protein
MTKRKPKMKTIGLRLALRQEGKYWTAYIANEGTWDGAFIIGSIAMGPVKEHAEIKDGFLQLMKLVLTTCVEDITGRPPTEWETSDAPEHERSEHS